MPEPPLETYQPPQLGTSEGKYETLFENVHAGAFLTNFDGEILEANQRSCDLFGYSWEDLVTMNLQNLLPADIDWEELQDEIASRGGINLEVEGPRKDKTIFPFELSASLFQLKKKPVMFVLIRDITERKTAERKLKEKEAKYRGLFEYATDGMFVLDIHGEIKEVNTKLCSMVGYKEEELTGKNLFNMDLLTARSLPVVLQEFEQLLSQKTSKNCTSEIRRKNGGILDVEFSSFFLVRQQNEVDNFVLMVRDVTERNASMKDQQHEREMLRTLLDNIPDSVYFKDEQNRFIMVNHAKAAHAGVGPEEMIGKTDYDFMEHDEATRSFNDDTAIMQSGKPIINKMERREMPNGLARWTSVTKIPRYNPEGDIIGTMGVSRDITELELAKQEMERSEARYRAVFENQSVAIVMTDEQNRIISWNSFVEELLLRSKDELQYRAIHTLFTHDSWKKINECMGSTEDVATACEALVQRKNDSTRDVEVSRTVLRDKTGQLLGFTWILNDISKQKTAEIMMQHHHELLLNLMDTIPDSIYFKDETHHFVMVNKAKAMHWGCTPHDMVGKSDFDYLPKEQAQQAFEDDSQVLSTGKPIINKIERITDSEGNDHWFSVTKVPRYNKDGNIIGTIGISRDVTEWMVQQQA